MAITANIAFIEAEFVATLSDGRRLRHGDLILMAELLHKAGVLADSLTFEWHAGQRMITAGQQSALIAEVRRWERKPKGFTAAA